MPKYTFQNPKTKKVHELFCSYEEMEKFKEENPTYNQIFAMNLGDPVRLGVIKPDAGFQKHVIDRIKKNVHGNTLGNSRFSIPREI